MKYIGAGVLLAVVVGVYLAVSYLRGKVMGQDGKSGGCSGGCAGCAQSGSCGIESQDRKNKSI